MTPRTTMLRRRPYDKTFKKEQYSPDPSEPERPGLRHWRTLWDSGIDWALIRVDEYLVRKAGKAGKPRRVFQGQAPRPLRSRTALRPVYPFKKAKAGTTPSQFSKSVAGIDRYAIAIRIDQLEVVVTKELVLSNCIYRQSLFH